jgi:hypothetical protein
LLTGVPYSNKDPKILCCKLTFPLFSTVPSEKCQEIVLNRPKHLPSTRFKSAHSPTQGCSNIPKLSSRKLRRSKNHTE